MVGLLISLYCSYLFKSLCITIIFVIFLSKNIYFRFLLASRGVMSHVRQSRFQHEENSRVTPRSDTNINKGREERDARFLAGNTVIILSQ